MEWVTVSKIYAPSRFQTYSDQESYGYVKDVGYCCKTYPLRAMPGWIRYGSDCSRNNPETTVEIEAAKVEEREEILQLTEQISMVPPSV